MKTICLAYLMLASCLLASAAAESNDTVIAGSPTLRDLLVAETVGIGQSTPVEITIAYDGPGEFIGPVWANLFADDLLIEENGVSSLVLVSGGAIEISFERPITFMSEGGHVVMVQIGSGENIFDEKSAVVSASGKTQLFRVVEFKIEPAVGMADSPFSAMFTVKSYADRALTLECSLSVTRLPDEGGKKIRDLVTSEVKVTGETFKLPPGGSISPRLEGFYVKLPGTYLCNFSCSDGHESSSWSQELRVGGEILPVEDSSKPGYIIGSIDSRTDMGGSSTSNVAPSSKSESATPLAILLLLAAVAAIAFGAIYYFEKKRRKVKTKEISEDLEEAIELERLKQKRDEIEEMIKIAKAKYYKRAMDEDVYKKIVAENQNKLIEIEAKINEIEKRVEKLEGSLKKAGK